MLWHEALAERSSCTAPQHHRKEQWVGTLLQRVTYDSNEAPASRQLYLEANVSIN